MKTPKHIRFNPSKGFIATYHKTKEELPSGDYAAMVSTNNKSISSFELETLSLDRLEEILKDKTEVQLVMKEGKEYKAFLKEDQLYLAYEDTPSDVETNEYMYVLALNDKPLCVGPVDLTSGNFIDKLLVGTDWSIKLSARRSGAQSDTGEYLYFPTSKEACEAVWVGKITSLTSKGLGDEQARRYIKYALQVPYPYADDILNFVIHQVVEYSDYWHCASPKTIEDVDRLIKEQASSVSTISENRRWVAYNLMLASLDLEVLGK